MLRLKTIVSSILLLVLTSVAHAQELDWTNWRTLPVFYEGRIMPLETFARRTVYRICGAESPTLILNQELLENAVLAGHLSGEQAKQIRNKFPQDGKQSRTFASYQLLFDWIVEPELWEFIPFLPTGSEELREEFFSTKGTSNDVAPVQVSENAEKIENFLLDYDRSKTDFSVDPLKNKHFGKPMESLKNSYLFYRSFTSDSRITTPQVTLSMLEQATRSLETAFQAHNILKQSGINADELSLTKNDELEKIFSKFRTILSLYQRSLETTGQPVQTLVQEKLFEMILDSLDDVIPAAQKFRDQAFEKIDSQQSDEQLRLFRSMAQTFLYQLKQCRMFTEAAYVAIYDSDEMLHVCPILSAEVLKADHSSAIVSHPWVSLQTFLLGSDAMIHRFTGQTLQNPDHNVRAAFQEMVAAYLGNDSNRRTKFSDASKRLQASLRELAESAEPSRRNLLPDELQDEAIFAKTAMPQKNVIHAEYFYEQLRPFHYLWLTSLIAFCLFAIATLFSLFPKRFRSWEIFSFWGGVLFLSMTVLVTFVGGAFRTWFTGWLPISSKFETIVLMAFSTVLFGFWATFYPCIAPKFQKAWQLVSLRNLSNNENPINLNEANFWRMILILPRTLLTVITFYLLMLASYSEQGNGTLSWHIIKQSFLMNDPLDWFVVLFCIGTILWLIPKIVLAICIFPFVRKPKPNDSMPKLSFYDQILPRKLFLLVAAFLAFGAGMYANKQAMNFMPLQAVLRSNFWLAVHVFAIIVSYASGTIAWLLALIATGNCIFSKWEQTVTGENTPSPGLPKLARTLLPYIKQLLGVTVLCLAIGTILGGRWADYSWGRFWGWDPKEVWALITLLFYAVILHGRAARLYGDFGLLIGTQAGIFAILMTWYGVNEVLKTGKHAYASSDTGSWVAFILFIFVLVNVLWGTIAIARFVHEKYKTQKCSSC